MEAKRLCEVKMKYGQFVVLALCFVQCGCLRKADNPKPEPSAPPTQDSEEIPVASPSRIVGQLREPESTYYHEVRQGETLSKIAETYRVGLEEIVKANGLSDPNHIKPGQLLAIPGIPEQDKNQP